MTIIRIFVKSQSLFSAIIQKPQEKSYWHLSMETRVMLNLGLQKYVITTSLNDNRWELSSCLLKVACLIYRIKTIGHSNDKNLFADTFRKRPYSASEYKIKSQEFRKNPDWGGKIETFVEYSKISYSSKIRQGRQQTNHRLHAKPY